MTEKSPKDAAATEKLKRYWAEGPGAAKIQWGKPGDFDRCRIAMKGKVPGHMIDGYCNHLHQRATGKAPGKA